MNNDSLARIWDQEIVPVWSEPFGRPLLERLDIPPKSTVLDVGCGTGYPALDIIDRVDAATRVIAIDRSGPMLDLARRRAGGLAGKRIFLKSEDVERLSFADDVFDAVVANLSLLEVDDPRGALLEALRVLCPGGQIGITLPLRGTFVEFFDLFREALEHADMEDTLARLDAYMTTFRTPKELKELLTSTGFDEAEVKVHRFSLLFRSSREFFFAPVIEHGFLQTWKDLTPGGRPMQSVFLAVKRAIDTYYASGPFNLSVEAGVAIARRPLGTDPGAVPIIGG